MALTTQQLKNLKSNTVSRMLLIENGLGNDYYLNPLVFIENELHLRLTCTGDEYRHAVETACDEDICPIYGATTEVIVDGILAFIFRDYLRACGLSLMIYFTYRFTPPSQEFQDKLDKFDEMVNAHKVKVVA